MKTILNWKKGLLSQTYEVRSGGDSVGFLKNNTWKESAEGELFGNRFSFKSKGFLKKETQIFDEQNVLIGTITYNSWWTKATIACSNKTVHWQYDNFWNTKWSLQDAGGLKIRFDGSSTKGNIEFDEMDALMILTGLYITNYYWSMTIALMLILFVPIFAS